MARGEKDLMGRMLVWLCLAGGLGVPVQARDTRLVLRLGEAPSKPGATALLPQADSLRADDAAPWYEKAAKALPSGAKSEDLRQWSDTPLDELPLQQVEQTLQPYIEGLQCVAKATRCQQCTWPAWKPGTTFAYEKEYRTLAFAVALWARLEIAQGRYEGAELALQTGFAMVRQLGDGPSLMQALIAAAIGSVMCQEVEQWLQQDDAPNLLSALTALPRPFVDMEKAIARETQAGGQGLANKLLQKAARAQLKQAHDRTRLLGKRLDSRLAVLRCVEALRAYAASHEGSLPRQLGDIEGFSAPEDPVSGKPFTYTWTESMTVLESEVPKAGGKVDRTRYEIVVTK